MGLYLCVFDGDRELEGVEVGSYADFGFLRQTVLSEVEHGTFASKCPVLMNHSDSDGEWPPAQAAQLIQELDLIESELRKKPPVDFNSDWKKQVARKSGIVPKNLAECFFDVDGEPLIERMRHLAKTSAEAGKPILFQ